MRPAQLKVGPHVYRVHWNRKAWAQLVADDDRWTNHVGVTKHLTQEIWVRPALSDGQAIDTLLHEALHALYCASGLSDIDEPVEESVVNHLSPWLLMLLRDNPELTSLLLHDVAS